MNPLVDYGTGLAFYSVQHFEQEKDNEKFNDGDDGGDGGDDDERM